MSMRALKFTKIDFIKTKKQMLFIPFYVALIAIIMWNSGPEMYGAVNTVTMVTAFFYMVFITIIFSTTPFGTCKVEENGFLLLLPATIWERVLGRFLYGFVLMMAASACGVGVTVISGILGYHVDVNQLALCLIGFAVGMVVIAAEYIFMYLCGEHQGQSMLGIVRTLPGMCFFFGTANIMKRAVADPEEAMGIIQAAGGHLLLIGLASAALSLVVFMAAALLCTKVIKKRGY